MLTEEEIKSFLSRKNTAEAGIKRVEFPSLQPVKGFNKISTGMSHLEDVQIELSVELGQASLKVKEVLGLAPGSVIKLNKTIGDEVEVIMNQQRFARGEVIVINDNFGVRIVSVNHSYHFKLTEGLT
ncbi:MAG: flagellar motor switch protein FliN [Desulfotomaculaceae bacterium]|nr:flagellar motor switch protein FliN [Desulfotomaculaceae bacterium]